MIEAKKITSLSHLLNWLDNNDPRNFESIATEIQLDATSFEPYISWKPDRYTRNCIIRADNYELLLLCWSKGQGSSIHSHNGEQCWVYNIQGRLKETRYDLVEGIPTPTAVHCLEERQLSYMSDAIGLHKLENPYNDSALSLHLYANPIDACSSWNETAQQFHRVSLKYDTE